ncbi:MAG: bifunctional phosphoribosylaminoimidazolecarboxamide formyltransferase/IMP cyclohydrolase [Saprospiraceae bacterium]
MKKINSILISVFHKDGLSNIIEHLKTNSHIAIYSTGGTYSFLQSQGLSVKKVEDLTSYPSILDGRVKTLHPKIFGGILAERKGDHLSQLKKYEIPEIDCVVVDLYPFEDTKAQSNDESEIIEKIDIGGIALIRAAAKNYKDVVVISSKDSYDRLEMMLAEQSAASSQEQRKELARRAFSVSSHYDTAIHNHFNEEKGNRGSLKVSKNDSNVLRYGENPHQDAIYYGKLEDDFEKLNGKSLSYNNLVDVDAAVEMMREFENEKTTFIILKHTNSCGVAVRSTSVDAFKAALAGDPISAFGGILICNDTIDLDTAEEIDKLFYEVLIAPNFTPDALGRLSKKKNRILLKKKNNAPNKYRIKSILSGVLWQDADLKMEAVSEFEVITQKKPTPEEMTELEFANKCVKHVKSNTIVITKGRQLLGMGCGQTSRVDACKQAIDKAKRMGFDLEGAVMASDAFFPFPDCVELVEKEGIKVVLQPGGSKNDHMSIDYCDNNGMAMVKTGVRHFKH